MAKHGVNFHLKTKDGTDPNFSSATQEGQQEGKKVKKKQSKVQLGRQIRAEEDRQFSHVYSLAWHHIRPGNIAGFEILQKTPKDTEYRPFTYFAIIIDNLKTFPLIATTNDVHRHDILTDALCTSRHNRSGYDILLFGTRLEVFDFDHGEETEVIESKGGKVVTVTAEEQVTTLAQNNNEDIVLDFKTTNIQQVDVMFRDLAMRQVEFLVRHVDSEDDSDSLAKTRRRLHLDASCNAHCTLPSDHTMSAVDERGRAIPQVNQVEKKPRHLSFLGKWNERGRRTY